MPNSPRISVVLATHDRPDRLGRLLDGLRAQTLPPGDFEVLVVDDASGSETTAMLDAHARRHGLALQVIRREVSAGPATARNQGWRAARAPYVAFTDDDCVPTPGWLEHGLAALESGPDVFAQGVTLPDPSELHRMTPYARTLDVRRLGPWFPTANLFFPRALLERYDGFDETTFTGPGGEDVDLAWRAIGGGARPVLAEQAVVHHAVHEMTPLGMLRFATRWTETMAVFGRYPELRRTALIRGVFWKDSHYHLVRTLVAAALPGPLRWLALWCAWRYAVLMRQRCSGPMNAGLRHVPYLVALDAVEVGTALRGAIRYRTPVL